MQSFVEIIGSILFFGVCAILLIIYFAVLIAAVRLSGKPNHKDNDDDISTIVVNICDETVKPDIRPSRPSAASGPDAPLPPVPEEPVSPAPVNPPSAGSPTEEEAASPEDIGVALRRE